MDYERKIGQLILQNAPYAKVNLKQPTRSFFGILTNGKLIFGLKLGEVVPKPFVERRARKKPFFHPSAMNAKLARCMVNLAHAKTDSYLLDPFCGTGSTLIEAALIGCKALGVDVQRRMAKGSLMNVRHFGLKVEGIVAADAKRIPFTHVDCVVTDPPYGRSSTTLKSSTKVIVEALLSSVRPLLGKGQRICIALPIMVNRLGQEEHLSVEIAEFVENLGFHVLESHRLYVHQTLTREVMVYKKV